VSYEKALEAAGAKIVAFEYFGSYQGDWYALVEVDGQRGWVNGSFGSCSGCDAFEAEFGYWPMEQVGGDFVDADDQRHSRHVEYTTKLADFGKGYLDGLMTQERAEAAAAEYIEWDSGAHAMVAFVKSHAEATP